MQEMVDDEAKKLLNHWSIERKDETKDDVFIQPTVIAVKKDGSVNVLLTRKLKVNQLTKKNTKKTVSKILLRKLNFILVFDNSKAL